MKLLVLSDTHNMLDKAVNVLKFFEKDVSAVLHLGDCDQDAKDLSVMFPSLNFHYVKGNNDFSSTPLEKVVSVGGKKIFLTHGHKHSVYYGIERLFYAAEEKDCDVALFGHTHVPFYDNSERVLIMNPGSISLPRSSPVPTFGVINISDDGFCEGFILEYNDNTYKNTSEKR